MSGATREVELKARVDDVDAARRNVERAGAVLVFEGELTDRIYDTSRRILDGQDFVLRLRTYSSRLGVSAHLDWKGPTSREDGFKVRRELTTGISDPDALAGILDMLGFEPVRSIDRHIAQYELTVGDGDHVAVIRFERYPKMDALVEVEGVEASIEYAIRALGIPRDEFNANRLADFVTEYEHRTGEAAAIAQVGLSGD